MKIHNILRSVEQSIRPAEERAYFLVHEGRYKRILEEISVIASARQRMQILDVGCYPYHLGRALELAGYEVWGIASKHEPIKNKRVALLNIETDPFPYKDNFFDIVLCSEVVEHLPQSPIPPLTEMYRVTKPGGHMLVTTPNISRSINQGKMLLGKSPMYDIDALLANGGRGSNLYHRHNREYTLRELRTLVSHAGWTIHKAAHMISYSPFRRKNRTDHPVVWTGKFANYLAMAAVPRLRDTLLIIGKK